MSVEPLAARYNLKQTTLGVEAVISSRKSIFIMLFIPVWLVMWAIGWTSAFSNLTSADNQTPDLFLMVWIVMWTLGGLWAISLLLWQLAGREIIGVEQGVLQHRVELFGIGRTRKFEGQHITQLRVVDFSPSFMSQQQAYYPPLFLGKGIGPLAFDYGAKSMRIGPSFDEAEMRILLSEFYSRLPNNVKRI